MDCFIVTFRVDGPTLPTLLRAIAPECQLVSVTPEVKEKAHHRHNTVRHRGNGSTIPHVRDIILSELAKAESVPVQKLENAVAAVGFSGKSFSPAASMLKAENKIKRNADGSWSLRR